MRTLFTRGLCCLLVCLLCVSCALADEERDALFDAALEGLLTPARQADLGRALSTCTRRQRLCALHRAGNHPL